MPPYPVKAVANHFLAIADRDERKLTPMQLQKLVYFAHGWHLALRGQPLVDEHPEAWQFGPVFPPLYHEFKLFGGGAITKRATEYRLEVSPKTGRMTMFNVVTPSLDDYPEDEGREFAKMVIERVWSVYGGWNGVQLSQLSHVSDGPWDKTRRANPDRTGSDIPDDEIKLYFSKKVGVHA